jgi:hypothetical protein
MGEVVLKLNALAGRVWRREVSKDIIKKLVRREKFMQKRLH